MNNILKNNIHYFFVLIILLTPSVYSLLLPGFFLSDDGEWMIIRFSAFYQALSDGQFPVRFLGRLNFGYGYPVANFLYPGFMYMATPLQILGFGFVNSVKLILILSMLGGGVFAFAWLSKLFDRTSAFIGALFFTYTPYHIFDLYKRGSVGEVLSIGILPFIFWQIERKSVFWIAIGVFLLILAHNTLAALFLILILGYMFLNVYVSQLKNELISKYLAAALIGLGMASFFWIPAFYELRYTFFSNTQISQWASYFADIELIGLSTFAIFASIFMLYYGLIILGHTAAAWFMPESAIITYALLFFSAGALLFSGYLTFIQLFTLRRLCSWCLFSAFNCLVIFTLAILGGHELL